MKTKKSRSVKWGMTALILFAFMVQMMAPFSAQANSPAPAEKIADKAASAVSLSGTTPQT